MAPRLKKRKTARKIRNSGQSVTLLEISFSIDPSDETATFRARGPLAKHLTEADGWREADHDA